MHVIPYDVNVESAVKEFSAFIDRGCRTADNLKQLTEVLTSAATAMTDNVLPDCVLSSMNKFMGDDIMQRQCFHLRLAYSIICDIVKHYDAS